MYSKLRGKLFLRTSLLSRAPLCTFWPARRADFLSIVAPGEPYFARKPPFARLRPITETMDQNMVALHAANRMLDKDTDTTQGGIGSFLLIAQLRMGVLLTLARLLRWDVDPIAMVVRFDT
jgi:hypothetical protein